MSTVKPKLIMAGPGAGKTHNMVEAILEKIPNLSSARYMVVITYTNAAADNIRNRLGKRITIPENIFIGTIHAFLNRFIVIPYASLNNKEVGKEKIFIQCQTGDVFQQIRKERKEMTNAEASALKSKIKKKLNSRGYIAFDQTVILAKECMENARLKSILGNRIQYLFIDEFQDTSNHIFSIIDTIRKVKKTEIYCVGDPEQFIQSFDNSIRTFSNIPFLKAVANSAYEVTMNLANHRSNKTIVTFLNHFNKRIHGNAVFQQESASNTEGEPVRFIIVSSAVKDIIPHFNGFCDELKIEGKDRCIIAKQNGIIKKISAALSNNVNAPGKTMNYSPLKPIIDTLLSSLRLTPTQFYEKYNANTFTLRKYAIAILKAIREGTITDANTFGNFVTASLGLQLQAGLPVKIENLSIHFNKGQTDIPIVSNIHSIKGLEAEAVLAIARTEVELLLWIETDRSIREAYRDKEKTDYPRLGYVAFSRAKQFLCIACLEKVSEETILKLQALNIVIV